LCIIDGERYEIVTASVTVTLEDEIFVIPIRASVLHRDAGYSTRVTCPSQHNAGRVSRGFMFRSRFIGDSSLLALMRRQQGDTNAATWRQARLVKELPRAKESEMGFTATVRSVR
jgi:hypothetical protein